MKSSEVAARIQAIENNNIGWRFLAGEAIKILEGMPFDFDLTGDRDEIERLTTYRPHRLYDFYAMTLICYTIRRAER